MSISAGSRKNLEITKTFERGEKTLLTSFSNGILVRMIPCVQRITCVMGKANISSFCTARNCLYLVGNNYYYYTESPVFFGSRFFVTVLRTF